MKIHRYALSKKIKTAQGLLMRFTVTTGRANTDFLLSFRLFVKVDGRQRDEWTQQRYTISQKRIAPLVLVA
jgi:hypothetical protein